MAKRLIDADALINRMCRQCNVEYSEASCEPDECFIRLVIMDSPTVDAVEVVRCRDCRMFVDNKEARVTYCRRCLMDMTVMPDAFCSYGERKEK